MTKMHHRPAAIAFVFLVTLGPAAAQAPRIDPAGIPGAVLLCGHGEISEAALERFVDLAGGAKARIGIVNFDGPSPTLLGRLGGLAKKKDAIQPRQIHFKDAKAELSKLTGVWLSAASTIRIQKAFTEHPPGDEFLAVLKRSGVVATAGDIGSLGVLPSDLFDLRSIPTTTKKKDLVLEGYVAFKVGTGAALLIRGRTLSAVGPGATQLSLWHSKTLEPRVITLSGKAQEDLTALRRAAQDRTQNFPPKKVDPPVVENGTLVIVGGGGSPENLNKTFVDYAGGEGKAVIAIFATAAPDPLPKREGLAVAFRKAGAKKATVLYGKTQTEVESKEFLDTLKEATGLWFDGGRQWRFVDCYENTKALPLMFEVLKRGGVIGGTSAGATIQGEYLARGGVFHNFDIRYEGYERGLGFLKGVAIDQHFTQRKRHADMTSLMKTYPQYLGIGIDEATAIVVKGSIADVIGKGKVHFYDAARKVEKGQPDFEALPAGGRYDLKKRKVLVSKK